MEIINQLIDLAVNMDKHLAEVIQSYGNLTYLILFLIIFCETGLVVTPFLPGDSLLFVIGALSSTGTLDFKIIIVLLIVAAIGGNTLNYFIGKTIGRRILESKKMKLINGIIKKEHIEKTHAFYEKHGGKAIVPSRFLPILRTFAPFVAGIGNMNFAKFTFYNSIGGVLWVLTFMIGGYFFGNIPAVKSNFAYVILGLILLSLIPAIIVGFRSRMKKVTV